MSKPHYKHHTEIAVKLATCYIIFISNIYIQTKAKRESFIFMDGTGSSCLWLEIQSKILYFMYGKWCHYVKNNIHTIQQRAHLAPTDFFCSLALSFRMENVVGRILCMYKELYICIISEKAPQRSCVLSSIGLFRQQKSQMIRAARTMEFVQNNEQRKTTCIHQH